MLYSCLNNRLDRRPAFFVYLFVQSIFSIAVAFARIFWMRLLIRIVVGFTVPAVLETLNMLEIRSYFAAISIVHAY